MGQFIIGGLVGFLIELISKLNIDYAVVESSNLSNLDYRASGLIGAFLAGGIILYALCKVRLLEIKKIQFNYVIVLLVYYFGRDLLYFIGYWFSFPAVFLFQFISGNFILDKISFYLMMIFLNTVNAVLLIAVISPLLIVSNKIKENITSRCRGNKSPA